MPVPIREAVPAKEAQRVKKHKKVIAAGEKIPVEYLDAVIFGLFGLWVDDFVKKQVETSDEKD